MRACSLRRRCREAVIRQGRIGCALLGRQGGKQVQLVGRMVVLPESLKRALWVLRVIYGGIPPIKLVSTWKVPRNAYDRAIATY